MIAFLPPGVHDLAVHGHGFAAQAFGVQGEANIPPALVLDPAVAAPWLLQVACESDAVAAGHYLGQIAVAAALVDMLVTAKIQIGPGLEQERQQSPLCAGVLVVAQGRIHVVENPGAREDGIVANNYQGAGSAGPAQVSPQPLFLSRACDKTAFVAPGHHIEADNVDSLDGGGIVGGPSVAAGPAQVGLEGQVAAGGVVVAYTLFGGFLAVSLTDFVQGCIMFVAMILVPIVALTGAGGWDHAGEVIRSVDPKHMELWKGMGFLSLISSLAWGLGYFGQPHIIVRFMAIRSLPEVATARNIGMTWMGVAMLGSLGIGIAGRAFVERNGIPMEDPETIFIVLADLLFHPLITGFLLAALLAAIMSTISSQLLVASSSLTEDFYRLFFRKQASEREMVTVGRICVLLVAVVAALLAMDPNSEVLGLVSNAWAGFGAAFGPLILLSLTWKRMTAAGAVSGLVIGAAVVILWIALGWNESFLGGEGIYEIIPGFFAAMIAIVGVSLAGKAPEPRAKPLTQDPLET